MPCLMKLDESGDTIWFKCFDDIDKDFGIHLEVLGNGKILLQGTGKTGTNEIHAFVLKANENGEKVWDTIIDIGAPRFRGGDFAVISNGDLVLGYKSSPLSNQESLALTRTDSLGNVIWTKILQTNESDNYCQAYMTPLLNGGFVLGYCDPDWDVGDILVHLFGTDSLGNLEWEYVFPKRSPRLRRLITASNGDIIGCGIQKIEEGVTGDYGFIFRMTQEGELLWKRAYQPEQPVPIDIFSELNDVIETPDGGIAAIGTMIDSLPDSSSWSLDVWLLKVDADGCLTPGCTDSIVTATVERRGGVLHSGRQVFFRLWPNPVSGEAQVAFYQPAPQGARLRVFNAQGMPVAQQDVPPGSTAARMDFSGLPPGLYLVQYLRQGRVLQVEKVVRE